MFKFTVAVFVALAAVAATTNGAALLWTGYANNNQWDTADNWYPAQVPGAADDVTIHTGVVQSTTFVSVNSLLMGDRLEGKANLTIFSGFNVFQGMQIYQNGNVFLTSGSSAITGTVTCQGSLIFSSGSVSGAVSVTGTADLSGAAAKTITSGSLTLSGSSVIGGVVSLAGTSPQLVVSGPSTWSLLSIMAAPKATGASFDASKGQVSITSDVSIQADGGFGTLTIGSPVNLTLYNKVKFANTIHIPNASWVVTVGSAVVSTTLSGSGKFVAQGQAASFGAQNFNGMIACMGVACNFGGKASSVGNLVIGAGTNQVAPGTVLTAALASITSGQFNVAGNLNAAQLNFLGAGVLTAASPIKAASLYTQTTAAFNLNANVVVSTAANFGASQINFGPAGAIVLAANATSQVTGSFALSGPPGGVGFVNNGALSVNNALTSTNVAVHGTGSWFVKSSTVAVSSAKLGGASFTLSAGASISGTNACSAIGAVNAPTVKASIDGMTFQCTGSCKNIGLSCVPPLTARSFSFSG